MKTQVRNYAEKEAGAGGTSLSVWTVQDMCLREVWRQTTNQETGRLGGQIVWRVKTNADVEHILTDRATHTVHTLVYQQTSITVRAIDLTSQ